MQKVQQAAEGYLAVVEFRTIRIEPPATQTMPRYSTAEDWLDAVKVFEGDEEALREHFAEIKTEQLRQRKKTNKQDA